MLRYFSQKGDKILTTPMKNPQLKRGSYSVLQDKDFIWFKNTLTEPNQVITTDEDSLCSNNELSGFNVDWTGSFKGIHYSNNPLNLIYFLTSINESMPCIQAPVD